MVSLYEDDPLATHDFLSLVFVDLFTNGKFITIFSFLFGIGFYLQAERRMAGNASVTSFWLRRMSGLLLIGLLASACTVPARILIDYSIFSLGLLLFYRLPARWILVAGLATFAIVQWFGLIGPAYFCQANVDATPSPGPFSEIHAALEIARPTGGFVQIGIVEMRHTWVEFTEWRYYLGDLDILGMMLLGLYVGRIGAVTDPDIRKTLAGMCVPWLVGIGFVSGTLWVAMSEFGLGNETSVHQSVIRDLLAWPLGMPVLGLGYAAAVALAMNGASRRRWLSTFEPVGRMALTNYLFTGFVSAFITFQWGLGLYGSIYPAVALVIVVALLPVQILASRWWLERFTFGPFEWLWRCWTYGEPPPLRRNRVIG